MKLNFDKLACRNSLEYHKLDKVIVKTAKEKSWEKATVLEKASESKSYWVKKNVTKKL